MNAKKIVVVGAGAAGMMAAIRAGELQREVILVEKNPSAGKKLLLSGKGRCNLTNNCDLDYFLSRFSSGHGQFLRDAFKKFFNQDLIRFFQARGLKLKTERQLRVFPQDPKRAESILEILKKELDKNQVKIIYRQAARDIFIRNKQVKGLKLSDGKFMPAERIILATGGVSYPDTGSSGEGIEIARKLGHRIVPLEPGLVPLETKENYPRQLEGLTLKNIRLKFTPHPVNPAPHIWTRGAGFSDGKREIISEAGELLFTDFGVSGPLVLILSSQVTDWLKENRRVYLEIDLKPGLSKEQLQARILREFKANPKKGIKGILKGLLPQKLIAVFLELLKIAPQRQASQISRRERLQIVSLLKAWRLDISGSRPIEQAMVTRGGVSLKDIDPRTMQSRLIKGLYFAGEMIDVDADTGGFNLQAAFSTGYLAGESAALS